MQAHLAAAQRPSHARVWVVVFALMLAILSYIDRVALSKAAPRVQQALGINEQQWGFVIGAFGLGYALFEIPGGFLGDWLGPKKVLIRIVLWWSALTAAMGWMWSAVSLTVAQFLFAAGEAGCFPNLTKAFTTWLPHRERVRAQNPVVGIATTRALDRAGLHGRSHEGTQPRIECSTGHWGAARVGNGETAIGNSQLVDGRRRTSLGRQE